MKALRQVYYIFSYVLFILPPFILGFVALYVENQDARYHVITLFVNLFILLGLGLAATIWMKFGNLHVPSKLELKYLLFGLVGNIVVYFYTFQGDMNLDNIVTIYLILLIVLAVRYYLITKKIEVWELWILLPIFLFIDTMHLLITGCGIMNNDGSLVNDFCRPNPADKWILYILYTMVLISTIGYYAYKIYQYKRYTFFGITHMALILFIAVYAQEFVTINEKLMGTVSIIAGFLVILDFIVSFVNKSYTHRQLLFYLRTGTFLVLSMLLIEERFFQGEAGKTTLIMMVVATYASLGIVILKSLLHVKEETVELPLYDVVFRECTEEDKEQIKSDYGTVAVDHIGLDDMSYSLVALKDEVIVGFVSSYLQPIYKDFHQTKEAYINIIEVHKDHRQQGIATELLHRTEQHARRQGAKQIRAWSSEDKVEAIHMWFNLEYNLSPTSIYIESTNKSVSGVYAVKPL
jgi:ribosomal protein S18 acetylase RimI-like enzyme